MDNPPHIDLPLSTAVGALMRPTRWVAPDDSLQRAANELRLNGAELLPLAEDEYYYGVVSERSLALAMADGVDLNEPARVAAEQAITIAPYASGAEALRRLAEQSVSHMVVVDDHGQVLGLVSATDLLPRRRVMPRPNMVGGMATPFGVYLTNGVVSGGANHWALMSTGAVMFTILFAAQMLLQFLMPSLISTGLPPSWADWAQGALTPVLFLIGMRLIPLSGTHAAEHQVVHAIERGEDLVKDVVRRMPRVHPRCGTNLAAGATIFMSIFMTEWVPQEEVRLMVAFFATMFTWRKVGGLLQQHVTTRPASDRQLEDGIRAGKQLLDRYTKARVATPSIPQRLWNSGMVQVILGSSLTAGLVYLLGQVFNFPVPL